VGLKSFLKREDLLHGGAHKINNTLGQALLAKKMKKKRIIVQYCSLQHWTLLPSPVTSTTGHCFCFDSIFSFFLELFLYSSPVHLSVSYFFALSYCSWGSQGQNTEVACHSPLWWTTICQNSPPWPVHLGWLNMAWLKVSLS